MDDLHPHDGLRGIHDVSPLVCVIRGGLVGKNCAQLGWLSAKAQVGRALPGRIKSELPAPWRREVRGVDSRFLDHANRGHQWFERIHLLEFPQAGRDFSAWPTVWRKKEICAGNFGDQITFDQPGRERVVSICSWLCLVWEVYSSDLRRRNESTKNPRLHVFPRASRLGKG